MAQRYGGKYSPATERPARPDSPGLEARRARRAGARTNILFFAPFPFLFTAFQQEAIGLAIDLSAFGILVLAAWLTREGVIAHEAFDARIVARRPAVPRKIFAAVLTGAGLFLGGLAPDAGLVTPLVYAGLGIVAHLLAFGPDPLRDKGIAGADAHQSGRVARAVEEAERTLAEMREAIQRTRDRALEARVEKFQAAARQMFRQVEADPRDLTAARRYLGVYLHGARDATVKFAELWARSGDQQARADYERLLSDLERGFGALGSKLLENDRSALDIEIAVLRERLQREGISGNG